MLDKRDWLARAIYRSNPRGTWNNRVEPMVFEAYAWDDLDPDNEQPAYYAMADHVLTFMDADGWIFCPPDHVPFPRSRKEAEMMNIISEGFLRNNDSTAQAPE